MNYSLMDPSPSNRSKIFTQKTNSVELFEYEDVTPFYNSIENEVLTMGIRTTTSNKPLPLNSMEKF